MKEYYLTKRFKYGYVGLYLMTIALWGFAIGWFLSVSSSANQVWFCFVGYFLVLGIISMFLAIYNIMYEHIAVSEKGVEYHSPWMILEMPWSSIEKISYRWHRNYLWLECFVVDNSQIRLLKWSFFERELPPSFTLFSRSRAIPLSCFSENWRENELGRQIKQYAPQLFSPVTN